jgi:hypothetical protein
MPLPTRNWKLSLNYLFFKLVKEPFSLFHYT